MVVLSVLLVLVWREVNRNKSFVAIFAARSVECVLSTRQRKVRIGNFLDVAAQLKCRTSTSELILSRGDIILRGKVAHSRVGFPQCLSPRLIIILFLAVASTVCIHHLFVLE